MSKSVIKVAGMSFLALALSAPVYAADTSEKMKQRAAETEQQAEQQMQQAEQELKQAGTEDREEMREELADAQELIKESARVVEQLRSDPDTREALKQAKAVFIAPDYGRAGLGIGGAGGQGVLIANNGGSWSNPAFYNIGSASLGLEAGVEAGAIAFLVMSDKGLDGFREQHNFSLNADAGITIVNWSKRAQASAGKGADVIAWSDTEGLYGDLAVSVTDIFWDDEANRAYYSPTASAQDVLSGKAKPQQESKVLQSEFSALESEPASGAQKPQQKQ